MSQALLDHYKAYPKPVKDNTDLFYRLFSYQLIDMPRRSEMGYWVRGGKLPRHFDQEDYLAAIRSLVAANPDDTELQRHYKGHKFYCPS